MLTRFTHSRIRPFFSGGGYRIEDTLNQLINGQLSVEELPFITVIENNGNFYSLNNRRLYVLKNLRERGLLENNQVQVRIKQALEREKDKYLPSKCSLSASIMSERGARDADETDDPKMAPTAADDTLHSEADISDANPNLATIESKTSKLKKKSNDLATALPKAVLKEMPALSHQVESGKRKKALETIEGWCRAAIITAEQRARICTEVGLE